MIFENKVAIITNGNFGTVRSTAISYAQKGANVVIADCIEDSETLSIIKAANGKAIFIKCNISDSNDIKNMVDKTFETFGRIDYVMQG